MPIISLITIFALSGYGLYLSYQNITRLQQYEEQSEKAAKWSNTVAERLHKTRTTQTSSTLTLLISFLTTVYLLLPTGLQRYHFVLAALLNAGVLFSSRAHMATFWNDRKQIQVPFVEKFNEAIKGSETVVSLLGLAACTWAEAGALWLLGWKGAVWPDIVFLIGFGALWMVSMKQMR
ncbi:hypothetical protein DM02DRAFT_598651 [Periconia macrospinosa]|uniref:Uncharacterized protein n=1 Tax=Periconia macrospinosa TaxID=97972 RepID=A0A2V1DF41_9PLEO|nr:hypothetical protein DM02DRAFT_598651 [Periconia macrospinosa]